MLAWMKFLEFCFSLSVQTFFLEILWGALSELLSLLSVKESDFSQSCHVSDVSDIFLGLVYLVCIFMH